ncbi:Glycerol-3-phosphate acyltransferase [Commensalibacter sp. Nvir]|uniref:glycerol-3-phosphate 1-O-acyltransferase PlsY n=1 Tax=Commensalibacter sp. Nvir TaxID=3069817 RepID=UPI002D250671|nr:Glycerol-3-phosphate acyltransferase [Commensalibacter sp. Nvir]
MEHIWQIPSFAWPLMLGIGLIAYLIGSIPFGMLVSRLGGIDDIRKVGSGNIGATNVLRTGKKKLAALTLFLDMLKGAFAVGFAFIFGMVSPKAAMSIASIFVVIGHCYPLWLSFKGGKGVATGLGASLVLTPLAGISCCFIWLIAAKISKISSVGALSAFSAWPVLVLVTHQLHFKSTLLFSSLTISILIVWRHRQNIFRLIRGSEPHIGDDKRKIHLPNG